MFPFFPLLKIAFGELRSGRFFQSRVSKEPLPVLLARLQMLLCTGMLSRLFLEYWVSPDAKHVLEIFSNQHFSPLQRQTLMFAFRLAAMLCPAGTLCVPGRRSALQKQFIQPRDVARKPYFMQKNQEPSGFGLLPPRVLVPDTRQAVRTKTQQLKP